MIEQVQHQVILNFQDFGDNSGPVEESVHIDRVYTTPQVKAGSMKQAYRACLLRLSAEPTSDSRRTQPLQCRGH